jgi:integrase
MGEIELESARLCWVERHAACLADGSGVAFLDELAFASERLWSAIERGCRSAGSVHEIARQITDSDFAADELNDVSDNALAQMRQTIAEDIRRLEADARALLKANLLPRSDTAVAAIVADCCEVQAICAGMMRQTYCSHYSERHASALIAMLLHPAVNSGDLLPDDIRATARALVPYAPQPAARAKEMALVLTPVRVTALRPRIWKDGRDRVQKLPTSPHQRSRYACMTFAEAATEMLAASPHKSGVETPHVTAGRGWTRGTRAHFVGLTKLIAKFFGDRPVASLQTHDWTDFFGVLDRLPKLHHKSKFDNERPLEEICAEAALKVAKGELLQDDIGIGNTAINRNISNIRTLYGWLARHIDVPEIMWAQFAKSRPKPSRDRAYLPDQLDSLFRHSIFLGRSSPAGSISPGPTVWHNASYWVPIIIAYTGARLGEVCGLRIEDIRQLGGIHYMALRDHKARELKRAASVRDVPLHSELIRLRFLDFVDAMKTEGETLLFPELHSAIGRPMAGGFVELIGQFVKRDLEFMRDGELTHGIRHHVNHQLRLVDIPLEIRQALIGQRGNEDLRARRNSVSNLERLGRAIEQLPVVTAHLQPEPILLHPAPLRVRKIRAKKVENEEARS